MTLQPVMLTREVAAHFRVSARTINRWVREGKIRAMSNTRPHRFPVDEIKRREKSLKVVDVF